MARARRGGSDGTNEQGDTVMIHRRLRPAPRRVTLVSPLALALALALSAATAHGSAPVNDPPVGLDGGFSAHIDTARVFARMGESCVYGAVAGATSALLTTGPYLSGAWVLPPLLTIGMSAAGVGCLVASSGAAAAEVYRQTWSGGDGDGVAKQ